VERAVLEQLRLDTELFGVRAHVRERDARRLLHHVPELTGEEELIPAVHRGRLDEEHVSAGAGHGEPGCDTRHGRALRGLVEELLASQRVADDVDGDVDRRLHSAAGDLRRRLPEDLAELPLELADAGLTGVLRDNDAEGVVLDGDLVLA
jgi:hypothetical protein